MTDTVWSVWPAPAKVNLFLRITGRRPDGYHTIQTVFQLMNWGDTVRIKIRADGRIQNQTALAYGVSSDADITVKAAKALQAYSGCRLGAEIEVDKRIPLGGGFGGGSSDAATVLQALNHLWDLRLENAPLAAIGLKLGADVPVFVYGQNAWAEGIGEKLTPIHLPEAWYLLIDSGVHVPTQELFQSAQLTREQKLVKIAGYVSGSLLGNVFEPIVRQLQARIDRVFETMAHLGEVALTGTGGGCFMRFASSQSAYQAQASLPSGYHSWVVASAPESLLLRAVSQARGNTAT